MRKILILLVVLNLSCKKDNYKNKQLSFSNFDADGGETFLNLVIDIDGKVTGTKGYNFGERITGYKDIEGSLNDDVITATAYDENNDETKNLKIKLSSEYAEYIEDGKDVIKLCSNVNNDIDAKEEPFEESKSNSIACDDQHVLKHLGEMVRKNGVRGANVIKGYTIRKDQQTQNCDCEARLEGEYWIKNGPAPLDRHSVKEPKIRYSIYKNYEGETMIEITDSEI